MAYITNLYTGLPDDNGSPVNLASGVTGILPTANGGLATGGTTGQILTKNSATNFDTGWTNFLPISLTSGVSGVLPIANGGTNSSSFTANTFPYFNSATSKLANSPMSRTASNIEITDFDFIVTDTITSYSVGLYRFGTAGSGSEGGLYETANNNSIAVYDWDAVTYHYAGNNISVNNGQTISLSLNTTVYSATNTLVALSIIGLTNQIANLQSWIVNASLKSFVDKDGKIGIGRTSLGAMIDTQSLTAATIGTITQAAAAQTASLSEWRNSAGSVLARISAGGLLGVGNAPTAYGDFAASTTAAASLRIRPGTAPTAPNDGDHWFDGTNMKCRIGGVTKTYTVT